MRLKLNPLVLVIALVACSASAQEKAITVAYVTTTSARAAVLKYDQTHADDVIVGAPDEATGKAALATWREKVRQFFAQADAADHLTAAAAALRNQQAIDAMNHAVAAVLDELRAMGVKL
jgi:hypothetical protein